MITIDCSRTLAIKDQLLVYVADKLEVLPILQSDKFTLTQIYDAQIINKSDVLSAIIEFLESVNLKNSFQIIPKVDNIIIDPLEGKDMKENLEKLGGNNKDLFFECTHCGFLTQYEGELKTHKLIHYV
ncbi:MAG: C2H2-type zinc finger protein [Nitrosarchaeum sp.]|nr:C2H2-type zinc finger protein [Nitrosarchaeum sp.]